MTAEAVQNLLFYTIGILLPMAVLVNLLYNLKIGGFFTELEEQDPEAWRKLGSVRAGDNFRRSKSLNKGLFTFVPVLRQKAALPDYPRSRRAWFWFRAAAMATGSVFAVAGILLLWAVLNDLS
ncbi:MAG: hypothetical protein MRY76_14395 [Pseudomonadales bacterium]|nr:hypothetical protein [Pseudomonadales bacterium]